VTSHRAAPVRSVEDGLEVVRQWRPPERPLSALGLPAGTAQVPSEWWSLRRGDEHVVQAWTVPAAVAAAHSGKPSVFVFQGVLHPDDLAGRPRVRSMLMHAVRASDAVVAYSDTAADAFTGLTGVAARAIEPGIRLDAFTPGGERSPVPAIFCAADPAEPRKRVPLLVEAFAKLRRARPDAELWLMATPGAPIASTPGIRIVDPGADRDALVDLYRSAWVTVLPAFREAFGLVVAESLACGTPAVVMRDGGGALGILDAAVTPLEAADVGWVADPDPDALARVLADALASAPDPALGAACRTRAADFGIDRCAERYESLYAGLASTAA
jgi:glycosyltransferase involved in cell wall biosynthesis